MTPDLGKAILLAMDAHKGQQDKSGMPYIMHPLRVMHAAARDCMSRDAQVAAVLHDTVEDTWVSLDDVRTVFGPLVAQYVDALTRRKEETYAQFIERVGRDRVAAQIKLLDIADNTDPERTRRLPTAEATGLAKRYAKAQARLIELIGADESTVGTEVTEDSVTALVGYYGRGSAGLGAWLDASIVADDGLLEPMLMLNDVVDDDELTMLAGTGDDLSALPLLATFPKMPRYEDCLAYVDPEYRNDAVRRLSWSGSVIIDGAAEATALSTPEEVAMTVADFVVNDDGVIDLVFRFDNGAKLVFTRRADEV